MYPWGPSPLCDRNQSNDRRIRCAACAHRNLCRRSTSDLRESYADGVGLRRSVREIDGKNLSRTRRRAARSARRGTKAGSRAALQPGGRKIQRDRRRSREAQPGNRRGRLSRADTHVGDMVPLFIMDDGRRKALARAARRALHRKRLGSRVWIGRADRTGLRVSELLQPERDDAARGAGLFVADRGLHRRARGNRLLRAGEGRLRSAWPPTARVSCRARASRS